MKRRPLLESQDPVALLHWETTGGPGLKLRSFRPRLGFMRERLFGPNCQKETDLLMMSVPHP
jgi:hypothetical protein